MKSRPSYKFTFGKYKGKTAAQTPEWYLKWAYLYADKLNEDERFILSKYLELDYEPRNLPLREIAF